MQLEAVLHNVRYRTPLKISADLGLPGRCGQRISADLGLPSRCGQRGSFTGHEAAFLYTYLLFALLCTN